MLKLRRLGAQRPAWATAPRLETLESRRLLAVSPVHTLWQAPSSAAVTAAALASPSVSGTDPAKNATGVRRDTFVAAYVNLPNVGHGVDTTTLTSKNVWLFKTSDAAKTPIPAILNTTGGGDAIVLQPTSLLASFTQYTFYLSPNVKDTAGASFTPYTMSFTTGDAGGGTGSTVAFDKISLPTATGYRFTGVTVGPDNRLYAGTMTGQILRWSINSDGTLGSATVINTVRNGNGGAGRIITGVRFDPTSTSSNLILWVTHGDGAEENAPDWTGKLSRLTGSTLGTYQDYVTGLPRSVRDHLTNQIDFDSLKRMYIAQASMNAMGAPDNAWGQRAEHKLSAAILRVDYNAIATRIANGQGPLNVKTESGGTYNPAATGAAVTLYATGVRNAFDLLWHSNGNLYAPVNGSAPGGNTPAGGGAPALTNVSQVEPDWFFKIRQGRYYGHPNPTRGEYVLNGGNPTSSTDKYQVNAYPVGVQPDADWDPAIYSFGNNYSPDGILEYKSNTFGGSLKGAMLVARYSGGDDIIILRPDASGNIPATGGVQTGVTGLTGFVDPLDIAEQVGPGNIYVIEHGAQKITLLRPRGGTSGGGTFTPVRDPNTLLFNDPIGGTASNSRTLTIKNSTSASFNINGIAIIGVDQTLFHITAQPALPKTLAAGATTTVSVNFNPPSGTPIGVKVATLRVTTSSTTTPQLDYSLRGLATLGLTGSNEPSLQRILDLYQLPIRAGDADPSTSDMPLPLASPNDTVNLQKLVKAGSGPVTIEPLAVFASSSTPTIRFGYYNPSTGTSTEVLSITDSQTVNPGLTGGSTSFDPGSAAFGLYTNAPAFGTRLAYSEDAKNTWEPVSANRKKILLYPLKNKSGAVVANSYVMGWEEVSGSYDFQDFVAVIRNVKDPNTSSATSGPITGLTLMNADTDQPIGPFQNGTTISYASLGVKAITVRADVSGTIGSVRWGLDSNSNYRTENYAPYAIGGDQNTTDLLPWSVAVGSHTMTVTAYSAQNAGGSVLSTQAVSFSVADAPSSTTTGPITGLTLMNADTDTLIGPFQNNTTINFAAIGTHNITVRADTSGTIGSIRWALDSNSNYRTENYSPYAIGGDQNTSDLLPWTISTGTHTMKVTAYSRADAGGSILATIGSLTFYVTQG